MLARLAIVFLVGATAGCGEPKLLACDEGPYQTAVRGSKVDSPEGLDSLDPLAEMPLPEASPRAEPAPRSEDSPCLEHPPRIIRID